MNDSLITIFGLPVENVTLSAATDGILADARQARRRLVFFINAHCVNIAAHRRDYLNALHEVGRLYADGSGLAIACKLAGDPLADNVNGTDMFPLLCERAAKPGVPLALLGARPEIVEQCAANMRQRFPGLQIVWTHHGYFKADEEPALIENLNRSGARILLVAMGVPAQELWLARNAPKIQVSVQMAVGGLFDFYSGLRKRAPAILRKTGLEWTFRLAQEPRRLFRRYIFGNPVFLARTARLRLAGRETLRTGGKAFSVKSSRAT